MWLLFAYDIPSGRCHAQTHERPENPLNFMTFHQTATSQGASEKGIGKSE